MSSTAWSLRRQELRKLPAFARRDMLTLWSYRAALVSQWAALLLQVAMFYFLSRVVDPDMIPSFGGEQVTYLEFVTVGLAFSQLLMLSMGQMAQALRGEQLKGTLESLLVTPSAFATIQIGSVFFSLFYEPFRAVVFMGVMTVVFGLSLSVAGVLPAVVVFLAFLPFAWGLAMAGAASLMTFRADPFVSGSGMLLTLASGAYYPVQALPGWLQGVAGLNPLTHALEAARLALLGGAGWSAAADAVIVLLPAGACAMAVGFVAFRLALRRERRRGTLFLY